ncbi:hypothetical protein [Roseivirga sp.]|uniref:hypothetical protein n=1 Tax=Roseivirga sp. TaxID=1964215 RepID=UPI003B8B3258
MKNRCLIFFIGFVFMFGCKEQHKRKLRLDEYLTDVFNQELENGLYIIIPKGSCKGCRDVVFNFLRNNENDGKINLIFIGEVYEAQVGNFLSRIEFRGVTVLRDIKEKIKDYDLIEEEFPMEYIRFLEIEEGLIVAEKNLTSQDIAGDKMLSSYFKNHIKF